jgi:murein DD-endopeptidase MepM/ murein hydrolase activator NlpD
MVFRSDAGSGFGYSSARSKGVHQGQDIITPVMGSTVTAADEGTVVRVGNDKKGYGNYVVLGHEDGDGNVVSYTLYGHLGAVGVKQGQAIGVGEAIGQSGQSGNARGTPQHVHFEIRTQERPGGGIANRCDPIRAFAGSGTSCQ